MKQNTDARGRTRDSRDLVGRHMATRSGGPATEVIPVALDLTVSTDQESGTAPEILLPIELEGKLMAAASVQGIVLLEGSNSYTTVELICEWSIKGNTWTGFTLATRTDTGPTNGTPVSDRTKFGPLARFKLKYYTSNASYLARGTVTALVVIHYHV